MTGDLRPLTEASGGSCDWGNCWEQPVAERYDAEGVLGWLPVCHVHMTTHRGRRNSPRPKRERGVCQHCGEERALNTAGTLFVHRRGWDTCLGSHLPPDPTTPNQPENGS